MESQLTRRQLMGMLAASAIPLTVAGSEPVVAGQPPAGAGASVAASQRAKTVHKTFEFSHGSAGMLPGFCDYDLDISIAQLAEIRPLPAEVQTGSFSRNAYYLEAFNRPDDLFMYLRAAITGEDGLVPQQHYIATFEIQFASRNNDCAGVGGSEAAVWLKAGGSTFEPVTTLIDGHVVGLSIDKGHQQTGGRDMGAIGSIWNGTQCPESKWVMLRRTYKHPTPIRATAFPQLWIAVGTESGYEAVTGVYYHYIRVDLEPV